MVKYFLLIVVISLLWHMSLSTIECNRTIINTQIIFLCPSKIPDQDLSIYDLTATQLDNIVSILAQGYTPTSIGPFTSIPPNICLLRNLQTINFASNQIGIVDPTNSLTTCLSNVVTLNLQSNSIAQFPSVMIYNMPNLKNLNFQGNLLTDIPANAFMNVSSLETINFSYNKLTTFELWPLDVNTSADFSNNQISTITNKYFFDQFNTTNTPTIYLTNNSPSINFTDAVYEMYNQCEEVYQWFYGNFGVNTPLPLFTRKLAFINFGTMQINCSYDQVYFLKILQDDPYTYGLPTLPIKTATCINSSQNINNTLFFNSTYATYAFDVNSTVNFSIVYPRFCKVQVDEEGGLTTIANISAPSSNMSAYPHYQTAFLNPGACFFTFNNQTKVSIQCTNDTSNTLSKLPNSLLSSSDMSGIQTVTFPTSISSLPSYLCSLPSHIIDLSHQAFTTLSDATFPCLDAFSKVTLSYNQITSVNMASGDFKNLTILDLSSNQLTTLPYSILRPTPTSLRYLDLRNNSITSIDLFIYTLQNITINLDNNPINSSVIINPQNATLGINTTSTVNVTFPAIVTSSTIIIQDTTVASVIACSSFTSIRSFLLNFRSATTSVLLQCTCASFSLKQLYQANGYDITDDLSCSSATDGQTFSNLTSTSCPNAVPFQLAPCTTGILTEMTTMESLNASTEFSSTSFTIIMTNPSSPSTLNTSNQTQSATSPGATAPSSTNSTILHATTTTISSSLSTNFTALPTTTTISSSVPSPPQPSGSSGGSSGGSSSTSTGLIVGLVVGIVGFFLLAGAIIAVIFVFTSKRAAVAAKKPVSRAKVISQTPGDSLSTRVQPRNLRSVRLAPIPASASSALPDIPVKTVAATNAPFLAYPNTTIPTSAKGIPIRLDTVRSPSEINPQYPPNSNALNNASSFRPINGNLSTHQVQLPQQQPQVPKPQNPRANMMLNTGGDLRH